MDASRALKGAEVDVSRRGVTRRWMREGVVRCYPVSMRWPGQIERPMRDRARAGEPERRKIRVEQSD